MSPEDRTPPFYHRWTPADAGLTFTLAIATFLMVPVFAGAALAGLCTAEAIALAGVPILVVSLRGLPLATLGLVRPPARSLIGATLVGLGLWVVASRASEPWAELLGDHGEAVQPIADLVAEMPIASLVLLSLFPAVCEEIATRGVLTLGLRRLGAPAAIAISTVAFAALHLSLVRALPTAMLGATLAVIAIRAGSVVPGMITHAINNLLALAVSTDRLPPVARALDAHPDLCLAGALGITLVGLGIAWGPRSDIGN